MSVVTSFLNRAGEAASGAFHTVADLAPVQAVVNANATVRNGISNGVNGAVEGVHGLVRGHEDLVNTGAHSLASRLDGVPVAGRVAHGLASAASFSTEISGGVANGLARTAGTIVNASAHPVDTAASMLRLAESDPLGPVGRLARGVRHGANVLQGTETASSALNHVINPVQAMRDTAENGGEMLHAMAAPYRRARADGRYGELLGNFGVDAALLLAGGAAGGGTRAASMAGRGAAAAGRAEVAVTRAAGEAAAARAAAAPAQRLVMPRVRPGQIGGPQPAGPGWANPPRHDAAFTRRLQMPAVEPSQIGGPRPAGWNNLPAIDRMPVRQPPARPPVAPAPEVVDPLARTGHQAVRPAPDPALARTAEVPVDAMARTAEVPANPALARTMPTPIVP